MTIVILRMLATRHLALAVVTLGCAVLTGGALVAIQISRYRRAGTARPHWAGDGRLFVALALHLVVAGVAAVVLAAMWLRTVR